jgi:hypothetical protein
VSKEEESTVKKDDKQVKVAPPTFPVDELMKDPSIMAVHPSIVRVVLSKKKSWTLDAAKTAIGSFIGKKVV